MLHRSVGLPQPCVAAVLPGFAEPQRCDAIPEQDQREKRLLVIANATHVCFFELRRSLDLMLEFAQFTGAAKHDLKGRRELLAENREP